MSLRILLVGNPTAQSGKAAARIERTAEHMARRGWTVTRRPTLPDGATVGAVAAALDAAPYDRVVYLGGDGTFAEVARGIMASAEEVPMGMMPSGTANDQGKSFGIGADEASLEENLDLIEGGHVLRLDAGRMECLGPDDETVAAEWFFDSAGWGMQPDILVTRNKDREIVKRIPLLRALYRDNLVYAGAGAREYLRTWLEPTRFTAEVRTESRSVRYEGLTDLLITGTAVYAGDWVMERRSEPDDGVFELTPFQGRRDLFSKLVRDNRHLPIWQEHLDLIGVTHSEGFAGQVFDVQLFRPGRPEVHCQVDGEEWMAGDHYRVTVHRRAIPIVVRPEWTPPWRDA